MRPYGSQFWYILGKYDGHDPTRFTPASRSVVFKQVEGKLQIAVLFSVSSDFTISKVGDVIFRFSKNEFPLITVVVTGGAQVGRLVLRISDSAIETYLETLSLKSSLIPTGKIDQAYSQLVNNIAQQAQALYQIGLPEKATSLLNTIDPLLLPVPPSTQMITYLGVGVIALALISIIVVLLFLRVRTRHTFTTNLLSEVQSELAVLEVMATKLDRNLADRLKSIKDRLSEGL